MPRIGIGTLILLAILVLPSSGMAKTPAPILRTCGEGADVCSGEGAPLLTASELFTIDILPKKNYFDGPRQTYIQTEWISTAEVLDNTTTEIRCFDEEYVGGFEDFSCDFAGSSTNGSFLLDACGFGIDCFKALPHRSNALGKTTTGHCRLVTIQG